MLQTSWVIVVCIDLAVYYFIKERVINISLQKKKTYSQLYISFNGHLAK